MKRHPFIGLFCLLLAFVLPAKAQTTGGDDELLQLLRTELQRNYGALQYNQYPPYFLAYRVHKTEEHHVAANFGHIYDNSSSKTIFLTIELRVGKRETDNYHYLDQQSYSVKQVALPLDENPALVRKILQRETERAYRESVLQYADNLVNATLYGSDSAETFLFLPMDMDQYYEPPVSDDHWNADDWVNWLRHCTSDASLSPNVTNASAEVIYKINRNYLVNSESSFTVQNHTEARLNLHIEALTDDNTTEHLDYPFFAPLPELLPNAMQDYFHLMEVLINDICNAPSQENLDCPVWLTDQAVVTLVHNLIGHSLENPADGLFTGKLQRKVMPEGFSVISDPTKKNLHNNYLMYDKYLNGGYTFDDEGVKSQRMVLVNHGVLEGFLSGRTQQSQAYMPNGSARGKNGLPAARQSNLIVGVDNHLTKGQFGINLSDELRRQNLPYGIRIVKADVVCDTNRDIITLCPTLCYKYFSDGREQLIRDIRISASPQQWLDNLMAGGVNLNNGAILCHSKGDELSTQCVSPDLLFRRLPVRHAPKPKSDRMIAHLSATQTENDGDPFALFFQVAQDERDIDENLLKVGELNAPYYQDYLMTDAEIYTVEASEGSLLYTNQKHVRKLVPKVLVGSDLFNNENLCGESLPAVYDMSTDDTYESFARDFRKATETEYRKAVRDFAVKEAVTQPSERKAVRERSDIIPTQVYGVRGQSSDPPAMNNLEHFVREASAELAKHDFLERSGVNLYVMTGYHYFWGSDKVKYSEPVEIVGVQLYGTVKQPDGQEFTDAETVFLPSSSFLFNLQSIQSETDNLLAHLETMHKSGARMMGTYNGPVLVEGDAVGQFLAKALLEERPNLFAYKESAVEKYGHDNTTTPHFEDFLDKIITSKNISVTANKFADESENVAFCRHYQNDAEGAGAQETEIIRNGELVALMGNRTVTKSTPYSNGFQQIAINQEAGFGTRGTSRLDFSYKMTVPLNKLKSRLLSEARKQGLSYAYIIRRLYDNTLQNIVNPSESKGTPVLQLYRVDVRTGKETPVTSANLSSCNFFVLNHITAASKENTAYPVMVDVRGVAGSRDFPFAGVPTCIVAPDGLLLESAFLRP